MNRFNTVNSVAGEEMDTVGKKIKVSYYTYLMQIYYSHVISRLGHIQTCGAHALLSCSAMLLNFSQQLRTYVGMEESITRTCIHSACIRVCYCNDACKRVFLTHANATRIYLVAGLYRSLKCLILVINI